MEKPLTSERAGAHPPPPLKGGMPRRTPALQCLSSLCLLNTLRDKTFLSHGGYKPSNTRFINKYSITRSCLHDLSSQDCPDQTRQIEGRFKCCYRIPAPGRRAAPVPSCRGGPDEADQVGAGRAMTFISIHILQGCCTGCPAASKHVQLHPPPQLTSWTWPLRGTLCGLHWPAAFSKNLHKCKAHV